MKIFDDNDVLLVAYLMDKTGYKFSKIYIYFCTKYYYFSILDDENINEEELINFIYEKEKDILSLNEVKNIHKWEENFNTKKIAPKGQVRMVTKMAKFLTRDDKIKCHESFLDYALNYEIIASNKK